MKYEFSVGFAYRVFMGLLLGITGLLFFGGISFYLFLPYEPALAFSFLIFLAIFFYLKAANAYAFTDKRAVVHRGWLSTNLVSIDYRQITDVSVKEPFFERIFLGTGYLNINTAGTGGQEISLRHIANPYKVKRILFEIKDSVQQ